MRYLPFLILAAGLTACSHPAGHDQELQARIDSLEQQLDQAYKPGFGEFMSSIQVHHAKLWFAGQSANWELAGFEIQEIKESLEDLQTYCADRPEIREIGMINQPLDSVQQAVQLQDPSRFAAAYSLLTQTCNACHQATDHGFNVIKTPENPPFTNQDFSVHKVN